MQVRQDGKPYHSKYVLSCPFQIEAFTTVLTKMTEKPEEYVHQRGRRTTNVAEGFHGTALAYREKSIDLGCRHYEYKTNMAILHRYEIIMLTQKGFSLPFKLLNVQLSHSAQISFSLQNIGPVWILVLLAKMGIEIPRQAAHSILERQHTWEEQTSIKTSSEYLKQEWFIFIAIK